MYHDNFLLGYYHAGGWFGINTQASVTGEWQQVCMLVESPNIKGYVNGVLVKEQALEGDIIAPTDSLTISHSGQTFDGYIALVRMYNRALNALEIQKHFNREKHLFGVWQ